LPPHVMPIGHGAGLKGAMKSRRHRGSNSDSPARTDRYTGYATLQL